VTRLSLAQRVLKLEVALVAIPHAFGGALALAYYAEPRATIDIDLNLFITPDRYLEAAGPLESIGVAVDEPSIAELVKRDGQARVFWDQTPIDLFFAYDAFHEAAARHRRTVPFASSTITILAPEHLVVCKVVYNRPKDWIDIEAMLAAGAVIDVAEVARWTGRITRDDDPRYERVVALVSRR